MISYWEWFFMYTSCGLWILFYILEFGQHVTLIELKHGKTCSYSQIVELEYVLKFLSPT